MEFIVTFKTSKFDVSCEKENPINPICGQSLLCWLKEVASSGLDFQPPEAEDWGWYSNVDWEGQKYLIGASAEPESGESVEWTLQINKERSFVDSILGRNKMSEDDECFSYFASIIQSESDFNDVVLG